MEYTWLQNRGLAVNGRNIVITWVQLEKPKMYIFSAQIFSFRGGGYTCAILRQLTDNEKMALLQTCDQLKQH